MIIVIALLIAPLTLLTCCFAVEVLLGLAPVRQISSHMGNLSAVLVVPAHDEEIVIERTLMQLKDAAGLARILVVADNCADGTAAIARSCGVDVIERSDPERRGKGFALDYARNKLSEQPPDIVLIVDADCTIDENSVAKLIQACGALGRPCQATYLLRPRDGASPVVQLSTFAFFIKNVIRQRALQRLAGRAHLLGTGMAFPWAVFKSGELATSNIVEDLKLGQDLAAAGYPPVFIEEAEVWGRAETDANTISQRRRWEGGFLENAVRVGPHMLGTALRSLDLRLLWGSIDTMIPPFALLLLMDGVGLSIAACLTWLSSAHSWPCLSLATAMLLALLALLLAWVCGGYRFVSLASLFRAPFYVAWKLPMYVGFARKGAPKEWQRTAR